MEGNGQLHDPAVLPTEGDFVPHSIGGWIGPKGVLDVIYPILLKEWICPTYARSPLNKCGSVSASTLCSKMFTDVTGKCKYDESIRLDEKLNSLRFIYFGIRHLTRPWTFLLIQKFSGLVCCQTRKWCLERQQWDGMLVGLKWRNLCEEEWLLKCEVGGRTKRKKPDLIKICNIEILLSSTLLNQLTILFRSYQNGRPHKLLWSYLDLYLLSC